VWGSKWWYRDVPEGFGEVKTGGVSSKRGGSAPSTHDFACSGLVAFGNQGILEDSMKGFTMNLVNEGRQYPRCFTSLTIWKNGWRLGEIGRGN
jgi:hypothetical protein